MSNALRRAQKHLQGLGGESWSILREAGASVLAYELYPLGIATPSTPVLPPFWQPKQRPDTPVLFLHGLLHNTSTFAWIKQKMVSAGWRDFRAVNLSTTQHTIPQLAEQTLETIHSMRREFGVAHVDVVAHSMGGILARYVLQKMGNDGLVRKLITLGTPHQGTALSRYLMLSHLRELMPGSKTLLELESSPPLIKTQAVAVYGSLDVMLWPRERAHWNGVRNIQLKGVGHAGLLFSKRVVQIILAHLHPDALQHKASSRLPRYR
jgi:triacylglycerol lipase